jgi:hypothetical protein
MQALEGVVVPFPPGLCATIVRYHRRLLRVQPWSTMAAIVARTLRGDKDDVFSPWQ